MLYTALRRCYVFEKYQAKSNAVTIPYTKGSYTHTKAII